MSSYKLSTINQEALKLTREEFCAQYTQPFLLHEDSQSSIEVDSSQTMGLCYMPTQIAPTEARDRTVHEIKPSEANPELKSLTLGRHENTDILIDDPSVSKLHARLGVRSDGTTVELIDMGSRNGTFLDEQQVPADSPREIKSGTVVTFGRIPLRVLSPDALFSHLEDLRITGEL